MSDKKLMAIIPCGALFTISAGEYSDYSVHGVFRAKADIDPNKLHDAWFESHPEQNKTYAFKEWEFLASIVDLIEPVKSMEWHLTDYSSADEMWVRECE